MDALVAVECAAATSARQRDQPTERIAGHAIVQRRRSGHRKGLAVQILMLRGDGIFSYSRPYQPQTIAPNLRAPGETGKANVFDTGSQIPMPDSAHQTSTGRVGAGKKGRGGPRSGPRPSLQRSGFGL